eukprot:TRINITY_DN21684_c0_g1_i2.p1 TRINITY_DN21684_c0_g1~~TRINITY_DN21684_c0_g1_i2.p1  ORF type:complete len:179 (-),score=15.53 TRINITY_DN21684_c0_g1_i2:261-722(-)
MTSAHRYMSFGVRQLSNNARGRALLWSPSTGQPPEEPTNCCSGGCDPCVWEVYYGDLGIYQRDVLKLTSGGGGGGAMPAQAQPPRNNSDADLKGVDRARIRGMRTKRGRAANGLAVNVLGEDPKTKRWRVTIVGTTRVLSLAACNLEAGMTRS